MTASTTNINLNTINYYKLSKYEFETIKKAINVYYHDEPPYTLKQQKTDYLIALSMILKKCVQYFHFINATSIHSILTKRVKSTKAVELNTFGLNFPDNFGFKDSESLIAHLILIHFTTLFITLHNDVQTVDNVLYLLKTVGYKKIFDNRMFKENIRQDILDDPYFQKELNRIKLVNSSI